MAAAVNSGSLSVTDAPVAPGGTITVEGEADATGDVTFLIQDPDDSDLAAVTKTIGAKDFSVQIDLSALSFGDGLDDGVATISADAGSGFQTAEDSTTFEVDDEYPTANIASPADGADLTSSPTISGTASDDAGLKSVEIAIQRTSDDKYYDGSSWVSSKTWLSVSGTSDWSYDVDGNGITSDGSFVVSVRATDQAGHVQSHSSGPPVPVDSSNTLQIEYATDTAGPSINSVTVTEQNGDDTVSVGDAVKVSADVTDATSGVDEVTVDASALGGSDPLTLSHNSGDQYFDTFTVENPSASDGSVSLTVTAVDAFGTETTDSDAVTLDTAVDSVDSVSIHQDFIGVLSDANTSVRVTASGVRDAQGNLIASGGASTEQVTIDIAGTSYAATVDDGEIDTRIDPTEITDDVTTGDATVSVVQADANSDTDTVELVHEARDLETGYQIQGTPMDATDVVFQDVSDVTTYDPTAENTKWVSPAEDQAGEGYYVYGEAESARMGFVFQETGSFNSEYLHEGYNLVGATPDLNDGSSAQVTDDLGSGITVDGNANVEVYVRDPNEELTDPSGEPTVSAFDTVSGSTSVSAYEGYFVYVETTEEVRTVDKQGYAPAQGS